jgi:hypothetical protein
LGRALKLWRGPALADLRDFPFTVAPVTALDNDRLTCMNAWVQAELASDRPEAVISTLHEWLADHPTQEQLWEHLVVALTRPSGRPVRRVWTNLMPPHCCRTHRRHNPRAGRPTARPPSAERQNADETSPRELLIDRRTTAPLAPPRTGPDEAQPGTLTTATLASLRPIHRRYVV